MFQYAKTAHALSPRVDKPNDFQTNKQTNKTKTSKIRKNEQTKQQTKKLFYITSLTQDGDKHEEIS